MERSVLLGGCRYARRRHCRQPGPVACLQVRLTGRGPMFRLTFVIAFIFLLWLQSLFTQTDHVIRGDVHVFKYNWVPWLFLVLMSVMQVGFAGIARRLLRHRVLAIICLLGLPLFGFLSLQFMYER